MKKNIFTILVLASIVLIGCESWLDVNPKSQVKEEELFADDNGFRDALAGVYTIMGRTDIYGGNMTIGLIEILSQTYSIVNNYWLPALSYSFTDTKVETSISQVWSGLYNAIANCNYILKNIERQGDVMSTDMRKMVEAEVLALRAYLHFDLLRAFAPSYLSGNSKSAIPYVDHITSSPQTPLTVTEMLNKIIEDLEMARKMAKEIDPIVLDDNYSELDYDSNDLLKEDGFWLYRKSHLNYWGITALAARVYLYKGDKANALMCAKEVINSNKFELVTEHIIAEEGREISYVESMARHEYISSLYVYDLKKERSDLFFRNTTDALTIGSDRKMNLFGVMGIDLDVRSKNLFSQPAGESNEYVNKYMTGTQIPLLKLSEMYLIAAESSNDISYLETLRSHRGYSSSPLSSETTLEDALQDEYRREFLAEGQLFFYYKRLNISSIPYTTVQMSDTQYVLPQPDDEIEFGI